MFPYQRAFGFIVAIALGAPATAAESDSRFTYIEGGIVAGFVNVSREAGGHGDWLAGI